MFRRLYNSGRLTWAFGLIVTVGFLFVNTMGFVDTETGSALGCGHEWPLCNGSVVPTGWGLHTIIEFMHRAVVGFVVILLVIFAVLALHNFRKFKEVKLFITLSFAFTVLQSFLGALGVLLPCDPPELLAIHLGVSLLAFNSVLLTTVVIGQIRRKQRSGTWNYVLRPPISTKAFSRWLWFTVAYTFVAMYVGAYVASTGSGGAFEGFPFPKESFHIVPLALVLDYLHRSIAAGLLIVMMALAIFAHRIREQRPELFGGSLVAVGFVCLQAVSGVLLVLSHIALWAFLLHVTVITCLFATLCYLGLQVSPEPKKRPSLVGFQGPHGRGGHRHGGGRNGAKSGSGHAGRAS